MFYEMVKGGSQTGVHASKKTIEGRATSEKKLHKNNLGYLGLDALTLSYADAEALVTLKKKVNPQLRIGLVCNQWLIERAV